MTPGPNIEIFKVPCDFLIKYGPKTPNNPWSFSMINRCQSNINLQKNDFFLSFLKWPVRKGGGGKPYIR